MNSHRETSSAARFPRLDGMPDDSYDVVIMGGGLAGLTLAIQLKKERPTTSVMVAEKREGPAPAAAFKVGESTVEISSHYFAEVVGMRDHMERYEHPKSGLRYFLPANGNEDISKRLEWGPTAWPKAPAFQLDRGQFENELMRRALTSGAHAFDDCRVEDVELGSGGAEHRVTVSRGDDETTVSCRWLVDATGRKFTLKKKLGLLKEVEHTINSSWLRLGGGLDIEEFSDDPEWRGKVKDRDVRRSSTNHLLGEGYWVWLIPLGSGPISIGIVADPRHHPFEEISTLDGAMDWLQRHEPQLFAAIDARREDIQDFLKVQDFAFGCERVFSPADRWCLTGEAGTFADPLYSPGSDFIAQANTFITDCVTRELDGEDVNERMELWNGQYLGLFEAWMRLYTNQYPHFGNPRVMNAKLTWDFTAYWGLSALRFLNGRLTDLEFLQETAPALGASLQLTARMEQLFRDWHELCPPEPVAGIVPTSTYPGTIDRQNDLETPIESADELRDKLIENAEYLKSLAVLIFHAAARSLDGEPVGEDQKLNPLSLSLDRDSWDQDGLFDESGISLADARANAPGVEEILALETVKTTA
jgi:flavin-dependent dehydrogenase